MNQFAVYFINHFLMLVFFIVLFIMEIQKMDYRHNFTLRAIACISVGLLICALFALLETKVNALISPYLGLVANGMIYLLVFFSTTILISTNRSTHCFITSVLCLCVFPIHIFTYLITSLFSLLGTPLRFYWAWMVELLCFGLDIVYGYFVYMKGFRGETEKVSSRYSTIFLMLLFFIFILFEAAETAILSKAVSYSILLSVVELFYIVLMTSLFITTMRNQESETNLSVLKQMWNEDRKQYQIQKENMDIINIKCHDLRHQIQNFRQAQTSGQAGVDAMMNQLENSIYIYDAVIKTGNDVLDVILSNVSLRADQKKIQLTAMVDGKAVAFLEDADTYSLFGNILDNALEYEDKVKDKSQSFISLTVKKTKGFVHIHSENFYEETNTTLTRNRDGSIKTTKGDIVNHGYGIKSMEQIVKKYNGQIDIFIADQMFQVDIMIPLPREVAE